MDVETGTGADPRRVHTLADLSRALELLRARAARGSHKTKISLAELARRAAEPPSTVHSYVTGRHLAPPDVLDRIVTALGATSAELREWGEAWFRVAASQEVRKLTRTRSGDDDTIPRELPADVPEFTGRASELVELNRLLAGTSSISAVTGMAGVGKTALVVRWGRTVTAAFPDGCLYVDLRGHDPDEPVRPGDALARFLRTLGVGGIDVPDGQAERAARYRTLLDGRRMLVVLDNARNTEQVRPLLPGTAPAASNSTRCRPRTPRPCCARLSVPGSTPTRPRRSGWPPTAPTCRWRCASSPSRRPPAPA